MLPGRGGGGSRLGLGAGERPSIEALTTGADRQPSSWSILRSAGAEDLAAAIVESWSDSDEPADRFEAPDDWLAPGRIELAGREFEVIPTPGHTQGHVVFRYHAAGRSAPATTCCPTSLPR